MFLRWLVRCAPGASLLAPTLALALSCCLPDTAAPPAAPTRDASADAPPQSRGDGALPPPADSSSDAGGGTACGVPFASTGPWCSHLPAVTPIASNSAAVIANIQLDIQNNDGTFGINTENYSSPIFTIPAGTATENWAFDNCDTGTLIPGFAAALMGVPTTTAMFPSMGTDSEITIYEPSKDQDWEFWVAQEDGGTWSACWGGTIQGVSANPGIFPSPTGATATGLPLLGFLMRIEELQAGLIQHTVNIITVRTQANIFSWPANRTDGEVANADILMEGQRLRLDPTFDVNTLPNATERTIAKAMQDYGMILTDKGGSVVMQAEDPRIYMAQHGTTTNPYDAIFAAGGGAYTVLQDIPIERLQVLPKDYGQSVMQ
jgi:hypothetical protein